MEPENNTPPAAAEAPPAAVNPTPPAVQAETPPAAGVSNLSAPPQNPPTNGATAPAAGEDHVLLTRAEFDAFRRELAEARSEARQGAELARSTEKDRRLARANAIIGSGFAHGTQRDELVALLEKAPAETEAYFKKALKVLPLDIRGFTLEGTPKEPSPIRGEVPVDSNLDFGLGEFSSADSFNDLVDEFERSGMSRNDAIDRAGRERPDLWSAYRRESLQRDGAPRS